MKKEGQRLRVAELFAGVGGFRLGLEGWKGMSASSGYTQPLNSPFEVVWSNQWEPSTVRQHANEVYRLRWPEANHSGDDIATVPTNEIPYHDVLVGGFPCQDYSVATTLKNSKGLLGKKGVLWWQIERILREKGKKAPKYLILENVDRLLKSPANQRGRDFAMILASLADLDYAAEWRVINAAEYGMPQRRRRTFIVAYRKDTTHYANLKKSEAWLEEGVLGQAFPVNPIYSIHEGLLEGELHELSTEFNSQKGSSLSPFENSGWMLNRKFYTAKTLPEFEGERASLGSILQPLKDVPEEFRIDTDDLERWQYLKGAKRIEKTNKALGYKYTFSEGGLAFPDPIDLPSRTIITGEGGKSPSRTKHAVKQGRTLRRLTPIELERLNMFPDEHTFGPSIPDGKRAFFMGNALVVGVVERIGSALNA